MERLLCRQTEVLSRRKGRSGPVAIRLTPGVYTHVELPDCSAAIELLPAEQPR
jgi:hypothetical protein